MLLQAHEQYRAAAEAYATARRLGPAEFAWAYLSGVVHAELGEYDRAAQQFHDASRLEPTYLPARLRQAEQLRLGGHLARSASSYENLLQDFPDAALAQYGLGRVLAAQGHHARAAEQYERALALVPQFGAASYALALTLRELGRDVAAREQLAAYQRHRQHRPVSEDPLLEQVRALASTARQLIADAARLSTREQWSEAIALHERALTLDPGAAQAHVNLISLYARTGKLDQAEAHYRAAIALGANLADAHYNYGVLLASIGRPSDALGAFQQALQANPLHVRALNNVGQLLARRGEVERAIQCFQRALANDPQYRPARFNLGRMWLQQQRHREAIEHLTRLQRPVDQDTPRHLEALAQAHAGAGEIGEAIKWAELAQRHARAFGQEALGSSLGEALLRLRARTP